jgi:hypothetical protein
VEGKSESSSVADGVSVARGDGFDGDEVAA